MTAQAGGDHVKNFDSNAFSTGHAPQTMARVASSGKAVLAPLAALLIATLALGTSGCSKSKTGQNNQPSQISTPQTAAVSSAAISPEAAVVQPESGKKNVKGPVRRLSSLRTYKDSDSGLSFVYPRKSMLKTGDKAEEDVVAQDRLPMGYVAPGGLTLALVEIHSNPKEGSDLFAISANKEITKQQCDQFATQSAGADKTSDEAAANQQPVSQSGSKLTFRGVDYSEFEKQGEQQNVRYYHRFVPNISNTGTCYEFGMLANVEPQQQGLDQTSKTDHKNVFAKLEKILASVKLDSQEKKTEVIQAESNDASDKTKVADPSGDSAKTLAKTEQSPR
jgi:hypothetical protein